MPLSIESLRQLDLRVATARCLSGLPAASFARLVHLLYGGRVPSLRHPRTFSELLAAKNLHDRNPLLTQTTDKYTVRDFVQERIGEPYLIPLRQYVTDAADLDESLLTPPCVIKATHGCDMTILIREGDQVDIEAIRSTTAEWLATDFSRVWKEWPYAEVQPGLVVEDFLGDGTTPPEDYKFYVFNGRAEMIQVNEDRFGSHRVTMFDRDWRPLNTSGIYSAPATPPTAPHTLTEMIELAEKLSVDFDFVRIDLYSVDNRVYFGEVTHYPGGGKLIWRPREFDAALGELWLEGKPLPARFIASGTTDLQRAS